MLRSLGLLDGTRNLLTLSWGAIAAAYSTTTVKWHQGKEVTLVDETDVGRLYNDFYSFLSDSGIDAVKCDVQSVLADFDSAADRRRLMPAYEHAFKANGLRHFAGRVIYCMAMLPQILLRSLLQRNGPTVLLRNSDGKTAAGRASADD